MMTRTATLKPEEVPADSSLDALTKTIGFTPMTTLTNQIRLQVAEKSAGSLNFLALLRWALVIIFLWFGGMKFTAYEAAGIAPFIEHSPIMSWLHALLGVQGASYVIGVIELSTAAALIVGAFQPIFSALGAAMA